MSEQSPAPEAAPSGEIFVVDTPYEVANWRPLVNWILVIPHLIIQYGLRILAGVVFFIYWWILIFTGRLNSSLYGLLVMHERYNQRVAAFLFGYSEQYAPFDFDLGAGDDGAYPNITVDVPAAPEGETSRVAALNFLLAIPHYFVLFIFGIGAAFVMFIGWFAVLFTGAWPQGMRDYLVRVTNYWMRIWVYVNMVETSYPKFGLQPR